MAGCKPMVYNKHNQNIDKKPWDFFLNSLCYCKVTIKETIYLTVFVCDTLVSNNIPFLK